MIGSVVAVGELPDGAQAKLGTTRAKLFCAGLQGAGGALASTVLQ